MPVADDRLHEGKGCNPRRIGAENAGAEGNGGDERQGFEQCPFLIGEAAFGADQQGGGSLHGAECRDGIVSISSIRRTTA